MTDTSPSSEPGRPEPRRFSGRLMVGVIVGALLCMVAAAGGGYFVGRGATDTNSQGESCGEVRARVREMGQEATAAPDKAESIARVQLNMVVQNPSCFPAEARAAAQDALDQQDQQAAEHALCRASDHSWRC